MPQIWYMKELRKKENEINKLRENNERKDKEIEKLKEELKQSEKEKIELEEENENLRECRKTYAKMLFKGKTKKVNSPKRGRKKGHVGVSRKKPAEEFIQKEVDVTLSTCPDCGEELGGFKRRYERVIEDIIIQPKIEITKYWIHQYECKHCGAKPSAKSKNVIGQSPFGRKIFATVLFYKYRMKAPIQKIVEGLKEIHGFQISEGGVQNLLYQASIQFGEKYEELKQLLIDGDKIHGDETGWRVNGENWWTWLWANNEISLFTTEKTRGQEIPLNMLDKFKGLLTRDGLASYDKINCEQQICWVHLLRKAHEYCQREKASKEMILLKDTLKTCYRRMCRWHRKKHSSAERQIYHDWTKQMFINLWKRRKQKWKSKDSNAFIKEWLIKHQNRLVSFLIYPNACPENNPAERALRPMVILRKITGGSRSIIGAKATDINMSIVETWAKQNLSIIHDIPVFGASLG